IVISSCTSETNIDGVRFIDENSLLDGLTLKNVMDFKKEISGTSTRSGWYFQQFLKMAYALVCEDEYYILWDADTIPLNNIYFFNDDDVPFLDYREKYGYEDVNYFKTLSRLFVNETLMKENKHSFITEHMVIKTSIMKDLIYRLSLCGKVKDDLFWKNILRSIDKSFIDQSGFSEFETYAAFVLKYYKSQYILRLWNNLRPGRVFLGDNPSVEELNWVSKYFDVVSIEDFDKYTYLPKIAFKLNVDFLKLYKVYKPFLDMWTAFRVYGRSVIRHLQA
ncbi:DUF6492 family protein, partial [Prevotella sp.]|uniref:DUF6492 family protein n=1 Tax=Prevotella sp. TaxID=59823 RepID=UPI002648538A